MSVPRSTRAAVSEALAAVAPDLGLPRIHVRWFKGARNPEKALYMAEDELLKRGAVKNGDYIVLTIG